MVKVNWTLQVLDDLDAIAEYIAHNSSRYASVFVEKAFNKVSILKNFPESGRMVPEFDRKDIRELIMDGKYRIIYKVVSKSNLDILTVHHSSRPLSPSINS